MVDMPLNQTKPSQKYSIYMYKKGLAVNKLQWLTCH